jgi:hypothetical protein
MFNKPDDVTFTANRPHLKFSRVEGRGTLNQSTKGLAQKEEQAEVSDEELEAAAGFVERPHPASSLNFSSYHLLC